MAYMKDLTGLRLDSFEVLPATTVAASSTVYVMPGGDDSAPGHSWGKAKRTIQAAIDALPAGRGRVVLGAGSFAVSSYGRWSTLTHTSGSTTVGCTDAVADDLGRWVISPYVPDFTRITAVTPGVGFTLDAPANRAGAADAIVTKPAITVPAGVEICGQGSSWQDSAEVHYAPQPSTTEIKDSGSGVTIATLKSYMAANTSQNYMRVGLSNLTVLGSASTKFGFYGANFWFGLFSGVTFMGHGIAGAGIGYNMNSTAFRDCRFLGNGTASATKVTGGVLLSTPNEQASSSIQFDNCFFSDNFGFGIAATNADHGRTPWTSAAPVNAATLINTQFNHIRSTAVTDSGTGAYLGADQSQSLLIGCWFETCRTRALLVAANYGSVTAIATHFNGANDAGGYNSPLVLVNNGYSAPRPGGFNAIGCFFRNASAAYISIGSSCTLSWVGCHIDPNNTSLSFCLVSGGNSVPPTRAAGIGQVGRYAGADYESVAPLLKSGTATLAGGTVTISDTTTTANRVIRVFRTTAGGTLGDLSYSLSAGTGFTITSSSGSDTSGIYYEIVRL